MRRTSLRIAPLTAYTNPELGELTVEKDGATVRVHDAGFRTRPIQVRIAA